MAGRKWTVNELNIVKGATKQRQAEDRARADAWRKEREAELEAVVNRTYDGMEVPAIRAVVEELSRVAEPLIARFNELAAAHYPAEFARPTLGISLTPGGIPSDLRNQVRKDAAVHLGARHAYMVANTAGFVTETVSNASARATDNPEVIEMLEKLRVPNRATPALQPPGAAIGILRKLLPHPQEWGFDGYDGAGSPLLPGPEQPKALAAPDESET